MYAVKYSHVCMDLLCATGLPEERLRKGVCITLTHMHNNIYIAHNLSSTISKKSTFLILHKKALKV